MDSAHSRAVIYNMKKTTGDFSFLSITPLPGLSLIKQASAVLLALSLCEAVSLLLYSPHILLTLYVLCQAFLAGTAGFYALHVCTHSSDHHVSRLQVLLRICLFLKLAGLGLVLGLATHKLVGTREEVCGTLEKCTEPWWQLSTAGVCFEAVFAMLGSAALALLCRHVAKVAVELRYRSLAFYLEL